MVVQPPDSPLEDISDLAALWHDALSEFKGTTQLDLSKFQFKSMQEAIDSTKAQSISFGAFRHDKGKVDAVRSAFGNNLKSIERIVGGAKMAADAAAIFPPALPGAALMTAFTFVFQTFKDVKADYDRVAGFFSEMEAFLDRVSMLETKSPKLGPFSRCVSKVFTGMLRLCSVAADYKGKGRFRKWLKNTVDGGQDPVLAGAYASVEDAIEKLGAAVGIATLRTVVEIKETTTKLDGKTDLLLEQTAEIGTKTGRIDDGVSAIREGVENLDLRLDGVSASIISVNTTVSGIGNTLDRQHAVLISKLDSLLMQAPSNQSDKKKSDTRKSDAGAKKHRALAQVRRHFADGAEIRKKISAQCKDIDKSTIESTCTWVFEDEAYKKWLAGSERILSLSGEAGVGKTYLARSIALDIEKTHGGQGKASVAYFSFREEHRDLRSFRNALRCAVLEIAEKNAQYCELIAAEIANDADEEPWKQFFADRFPVDAETSLYLVLDGVDEAFETDAAVMAAVLKGVTQDRLNIQILFTSRSGLRDSFEGMPLLEINVTKQLVLSDMRKLAQARIKSLPRLHKFHRRTKKRIEEKIVQSADSMLYIEHMLRRLSAIGRESTVVKDIETSLPESLEGLYKLMLAECQKGRTHEHYEALRILFSTLAFSMRELTLDEATNLIQLADPDSTFDIEDELVGRSARILELGREQDDDDIAEPEDQTVSTVEDVSIGNEVLEQSGKTPLSFQERSLREYFRSINVEENGLRTPPSKAHANVFGLLVRLLCKVREPESKVPKMQTYAAHFWLQHFCEIDVDSLAPEQFVAVLSDLHRVLSNQGNAALAIERSRPTKYEELEKQLSLRTILQKWLRKAQDSIDLDSSIKSWAAQHIDEPQKVFLVLAQAHITNWFAEVTTQPALCSFTYAKSALITAGVDIDPAPKSEKDIGQVLDAFDDVRPSAQGFRAIANITQNRFEHEKSIEFCDKGLAIADASEVALRFRLLWIKAWTKERVGYALKEAEEEAEREAHEESKGDASGEEHEKPDAGHGSVNGNSDPATEQPDVETAKAAPSAADLVLEECLQIVDEAMALLIADAALYDRLASSVEMVLLLRAACHKHLGRYDEALSAYEACRAVRKDVDNLRGTDLDNIFCLKDWHDEPQAVIDLLASWTEKERLHFFEYLFTGDWNDGRYSVTVLQEYATKAGDKAMEMVLDWWQVYMKSIQRGSAKIVAPKIELARFYRFSKNDSAKTMQMYNELLTSDFKLDDYESLEADLLECRLDLADTILSCFRASADPSEKLALLEKMRKLPNLRTSGEQATTGNEDDWNESQTQVMLALMCRTVGSPVEHQQLLNKSFYTSTAGLSDSVGWNDSSSFRLLAKVLACVPGLERDAQIALSCQFSITDTSVQHGQDDKDEDDTIDTGDTKLSESDTDSQQQDGATEMESKVVTITIEQKAGTAVPTVSVAEELAKLTESDPVNDDVGEDLIPEDDRWIGCNGPCERGFPNWSDAGAMYSCIQCADCDLCQDCFKLRREANETGKLDYWREFCGPHHTYVKGPVEGWNGVSNGGLRIGDERLPFKEWLAGLKDQRWPQAWEKFWKNEIFLRNVGF